MINDIIKDSEERMKKCLISLESAFTGFAQDVRTRAFWIAYRFLITVLKCHCSK